MSKIFYDRLIILDDVDREIKNVARTKEEREELWQLVDEIVHHRVFDVILGNLPKHHHADFLEKFHKFPHDEGLVDYLKEKIGENIEELIRQEIGDVASELLKEIRGNKS